MAKQKEVVETAGGGHTLSFIGLEQSHRLNDDFLFSSSKSLGSPHLSLEDHVHDLDAAGSVYGQGVYYLWGEPMDQISIKTPNPKCRLFLKIDQKRCLAAGVNMSEAPSPPSF